VHPGTSPELYNCPGVYAQLTQHDFILRLAVAANDDPPDMKRLAFGDIVNQFDLTRIFAVNLLTGPSGSRRSPIVR